VIDQDIRADHAFHRVEHLRVSHQLVHPGEQQVRLRPHEIGKPAERVALLALEGFEAGAVVADLLRRQTIYREQEAVTLVLRDL
jgi:hypothetical protein